MSLLQRRRCPSCGEPVEAKGSTCAHCGAILGQRGGPKDQVEKDFDDILQAIIEGPKTPGVKRSEELDDELRDLELGTMPAAPPKPAPTPGAPPVTPPPNQEPAAPPQQSTPQEDLLTYECPSCGAQIPEDASKCPSCGTTFSGGDQFDCPVCGSAVPFEAVQCPKCGVRFVEDRAPGPDLKEPSGPEEVARPAGGAVPAPVPIPVWPQPVARLVPAAVEVPTPSPPVSLPASEPSPVPVGRSEPQASPASQRELSTLVAEVKGFLVLGKRYGLTFGNASEAIVRATELAKRKENAAAVTLLGQAKIALEQAYLEQARQRLEAYARSSQHIPALLARIQQAQRTLASGALEAALAQGEQLASQLSAQDPRASETRKIIEETDGFLEQLRVLGFDGSAVREGLERSRATLGRGDIATAHGLALQGRDRALAVLKEGLADELKRAKESIFDMKLKGQRLEKPMEIIKRASLHFKQEEWSAAARELLALRQELGLH